MASKVTSSPSAPLPELVDTDMHAWEKNASAATEAWRAADRDGFLAALSPRGLWVRGLPHQPPTDTGFLHFTREEAAADLAGNGPLFVSLFGGRKRSAHPRMGPDDDPRHPKLAVLLLD